MMPSGVEHALLDENRNQAEVRVPLMPSGVEHDWLIKMGGKEASESSFDAVRR